MTSRLCLRHDSYTHEIGNFVTKVATCCPDYVIIHIGKNDLQYASEEEIANEILVFVNKLSRWCNCAVYVMKLIAWPSVCVHSHKNSLTQKCRLIA